eukprot:194027-Prymnesium_polylepis.1
MLEEPSDFDALLLEATDFDDDMWGAEAMVNDLPNEVHKEPKSPQSQPPPAHDKPDAAAHDDLDAEEPVEPYTPSIEGESSHAPADTAQEAEDDPPEPYTPSVASDLDAAEAQAAEAQAAEAQMDEEIPYTPSDEGECQSGEHGNDTDEEPYTPSVDGTDGGRVRATELDEQPEPYTPSVEGGRDVDLVAAKDGASVHTRDAPHLASSTSRNEAVFDMHDASPSEPSYSPSDDGACNDEAAIDPHSSSDDDGDEGEGKDAALAAAAAMEAASKASAAALAASRGSPQAQRPAEAHQSWQTVCASSAAGSSGVLRRARLAMDLEYSDVPYSPTDDEWSDVDDSNERGSAMQRAERTVSGRETNEGKSHNSALAAMEQQAAELAAAMEAIGDAHGSGGEEAAEEPPYTPSVDGEGGGAA